LTERPKKF